jgi:hypothetical protein
VAQEVQTTAAILVAAAAYWFLLLAQREVRLLFPAEMVGLMVVDLVVEGVTEAAAAAILVVALVDAAAVLGSAVAVAPSTEEPISKILPQQIMATVMLRYLGILFNPLSQLGFGLAKELQIPFKGFLTRLQPTWERIPFIIRPTTKVVF